jgi:hypothetical protein
VDFSTGTVIPFVRSDIAADTVQGLNAGTLSPTGFTVWPIEYCYDVFTGKPLVPGPALGPLSVVNVLGLDYGVPKPVAEYVDTLKGAITAMAIRVGELEKS